MHPPIGEVDRGVAYPNQDFMKYRKGEKRKPRFGEWYDDKKAHQEAKTFFAASKDGVPNNPTNYQSFTPIESPLGAGLSPEGDYVFRRNPYGDSEQIVQQEGPTFARPTQWGSYGEGAPMAPKADQQPIGPGWGGGPGSEMSSPLLKGSRGMSTGLGRLGSGPQRDVPRRGK